MTAYGGISTASIARGCASGTGAIGALPVMNASDVHGCENCRACLACRANGFGCAFYGSLNAPNVADVGSQAEHLQSELKFYALNLWRLVMKQS